MKSLALTTVALAGAFAISGCAGSPDSPMDTGELITQRGDEISEYGNAWSAGQQHVASGQKLVKQSDKRLERAIERLANAQEALAQAEAKVRSFEADKLAGQELIIQGNTEMSRAEADYTAARAVSAVDDAAMPR